MWLWSEDGKELINTDHVQSVKIIQVNELLHAVAYFEPVFDPSQGKKLGRSVTMCKGSDFWCRDYVKEHFR